MKLKMLIKNTLQLFKYMLLYIANLLDFKNKQY